MMHEVRAEIWNELTERDWTPNDLAIRMGPDYAVNRLILDFIFNINDERCKLGDETAAALGHAFEVSAEVFLNLEREPAPGPMD
jgi:plasmid maintenance system antidote protein VapI